MTVRHLNKEVEYNIRNIAKYGEYGEHGVNDARQDI